MPGDQTIREPQDKKVINMAQPAEVLWWCKELGCTHDQLLGIVLEVGNGVSAVRRALLAKWSLN